jgi:ABC-type dipeptide/oligopeptide/nickel transport system permease subunit
MNGVRRTILGAIRRNRSMRLGILSVAFLALTSLLSPLLSPRASVPLAAPSISHPFGTNAAGLDVLALVVQGTRGALAVGLSAALVSAMIGLTIGALAGFAGGRVDRFVMRFVEVLLSVPTLLVLLALRGVYGEPRLVELGLVLGLLRWSDAAQLARNEVLRVRTSDYAVAAFALGCSPARILVRHVLPEAFAPILVNIPFAVVAAVVVEVSLAVVGAGVTTTDVSWGSVLAESLRHTDAWWLGIFPGLAFLFTTVSLTVVGEGFRAASDPVERTLDLD